MVSRTVVHSINTGHAFVPALRTPADPIAALTSAIMEVVDSDVQAVLLFGSIARGEVTADSDIDLAIITITRWDKRADLQDVVQARLGNDCDALVFTDAEFRRLAVAGEPVILDILREGVALVGHKPPVRRGAA